MTSEVILHFMKNIHLYNVYIYIKFGIRLDFEQEIYLRENYKKLTLGEL